jgi:LysM repeat protein
MERGELTFAHAGLPGDMQQEWLSGGGRFGHSATRWSVQGLYQGNGSFEGRDASNNPTGTFSASSFAVGAQLAQSLGEHASVGAGAKFVNEKLGDVSGSGVTFDFGGQMRTGPFGFGASAVNVGGQMRYSGAVYDFPASYGAGVSYSLPSGLSLAVDANFPKSYYNDIRFGAEWRWRETIALRTGYRHELASNTDDGLSGPTFGIGAGYNGLWFDYGYLVSSLSGGSEQRLAISFHPGGFGLAGAAAGANGTGASHAPTTSSAPATSGAPATAPVSKPVATTPPPTSTPATSRTTSGQTASTSTNGSNTTSTPAPNARGVAATAATVDDTKPTQTSTGVPPAPASLDRAGPVATVTPSNETGGASSAGATSAGTRSTSASKSPSVAKSGAQPSTPKTTGVSGTAAAAAAPVVASASKSSVPTGGDTKSGAPATASTATKSAAPAAASAPLTTDAKSAGSTATDSSPATTAKASTPADAAPSKTAASKTAAPAKPAASTATTPRPAKVTVKSGDTLASIARQYGLTPAAIMMENNMVSENIKVGQKLKIPQ